MKRSIGFGIWAVIILVVFDYVLRNIQLGNSLFYVLNTIDNLLILLFIPITLLYGYKVGLFSLVILMISIILSALFSVIPYFGSSQIDSGKMFIMSVMRYESIGLAVFFGIVLTAIIHQFVKKRSIQAIGVIGTTVSFCSSLIHIFIQSLKVKSMYDGYLLSSSLSVYDICLIIFVSLISYIMINRLSKNSNP